MASGPASGTELLAMILVTLLRLSLGVKLMCVWPRGKHYICATMGMFPLCVT